MSKYYLVGDVGATKTNLAVCVDRNVKKYSVKEKFLTSDFPSLESLIGHFLSRESLAIDRAVLAVAGPVLNDKVTMSSSNLPWEIDRSGLIQELNIPDILLINDLEALAQSIPLLDKDDLHCLNRGERKENASVAGSFMALRCLVNDRNIACLNNGIRWVPLGSSPRLTFLLRFGHGTRPSPPFAGIRPFGSRLPTRR